MPDTCAGVSPLAVSMPSVITTTARRRPVRVATRLRGFGDRIVQRSGPERIDLPQRTLQGTRIDRERGHLVQPAVKREQRGFVAARLQPREHVMGRKLRGEHAIGDAHAAADIEENREADWRRLGAEIGDPARYARCRTLRNRWRSSPCTSRPFRSRTVAVTVTSSTPDLKRRRLRPCRRLTLSEGQLPARRPARRGGGGGPVPCPSLYKLLAKSVSH